MSARAVEILRSARERLSKPEAWTKGHLALDVDGRDVPTNSDRACRWCAVGAIYADSQTDWFRDRCDAEKALFDAIGLPSIEEWNDADSTNYHDVLTAFDRAIAAAEVAP
jgi:hypothetical protein